MTYPVQDNNHVTEGLALLTDHYKSKPVISGILTAFMNRCQEIENMLWGVITAGLLSTPPTGDALTRLADIVGLKRNTSNDAELLAEVILQIRANRSQGGATDIIAIATLAAQGASVPVYYAQPIAAFTVEISNLQNALLSAPNDFVHYMRIAKSVGTRGMLVYSTWPSGDDFSWSSVSDSTQGEAGWSSVSETSVGGLLMACEATSP